MSIKSFAEFRSTIDYVEKFVFLNFFVDLSRFGLQFVGNSLNSLGSKTEHANDLDCVELHEGFAIKKEVFFLFLKLMFLVQEHALKNWINGEVLVPLLQISFGDIIIFGFEFNVCDKSVGLNEFEQKRARKSLVFAYFFLASF